MNQSSLLRLLLLIGTKVSTSRIDAFSVLPNNNNNPHISASQYSSASFSTTTTTTTTTLYMNKKRSNSNKKKNKGSVSSKGFGGALRELQANTFPYAGSVRPGKQSPQKIVVEEGIMRPDYADDGRVSWFLFILYYSSK